MGTFFSSSIGYRRCSKSTYFRAFTGNLADEDGPDAALFISTRAIAAATGPFLLAHLIFSSHTLHPHFLNFSSQRTLNHKTHSKITFSSFILRNLTIIIFFSLYSYSLRRGDNRITDRLLFSIMKGENLSLPIATE
ncbi:hypothetical protein L6164_031234 [Bauhinia variegata]|uniref:Uncharacterized protein n=1 Tax=Bauhinia variegata TaxID=167791 RepID=A0ACB9LF17_BAUVA|nr:hypothetical protein L6164_031234 [Bauhinia variegata]